MAPGRKIIIDEDFLNQLIEIATELDRENQRLMDYKRRKRGNPTHTNIVGTTGRPLSAERRHARRLISEKNHTYFEALFILAIQELRSTRSITTLRASNIKRVINVEWIRSHGKPIPDQPEGWTTVRRSEGGGLGLPVLESILLKQARGEEPLPE